MNFLPGLQNLLNVHPLFVHFPIALIFVALLFEGFWLITKKNRFREFATTLLYLGALSAVAAIATGYMASDSLGHDAPRHEFVHEHRNIMLWMSGLLLLTALTVLLVRPFREGKLRRLLIVPLLVVSGLLVYGADKGGRLVFEYGLGVKAVSEKATLESDGHEHEDSGESVVPHPTTSLPDSSLKSKNHTKGEGHVH